MNFGTAIIIGIGFALDDALVEIILELLKRPIMNLVAKLKCKIKSRVKKDIPVKSISGKPFTSKEVKDQIGFKY